MNEREYLKLYSFEDSYWWFVGRERIVLSLLNACKRKLGLRNPKILDIGCGTGKMLEALNRVGDAHGADISEHCIKFCKKRGLKITKSDVEKLNFKPNSFDIIVAADIIEHVDDRKALKEIYKALKPGGFACFNVPAFKSLWSEHDIALHHLRRYSRVELKKKLRRAGFGIRKLSYTNSLLFPAVASWRLMNRLIKGKPTRKKAQTTLVPLPKPVNTLLTQILSAEAKLLKHTNLPFGLSLTCVAQKPNEK